MGYEVGLHLASQVGQDLVVVGHNTLRHEFRTGKDLSCHAVDAYDRDQDAVFGQARAVGEDRTIGQPQGETIDQQALSGYALEGGQVFAVNSETLAVFEDEHMCCLLYTSPSPRDGLL